MTGGAIGSLHAGKGSIQVRDEVCGMEFPIEQTLTRARLRGRTFHFCSVRCKWLFLAHPGWYVLNEADRVNVTRR